MHPAAKQGDSPEREGQGPACTLNTLVRQLAECRCAVAGLEGVDLEVEGDTFLSTRLGRNKHGADAVNLR